MDVKPNMHFGSLETKWYWNNKKYGRIWKCICDCGGYCYVKEEALIVGIAKECDSIIHHPRSTNKYYLGAEESYAYARGEAVTPEETIAILKKIAHKRRNKVYT